MGATTDTDPTRITGSSPKSGYHIIILEPMFCKKYILACAPNKDSDQPAQSRSLIIVFDERFMGSQWPNAFSGGKPRLVDAQTYFNLR